jgi:hypothetical protein
MHGDKEVSMREALGRELAGHFWEDWEDLADPAARASSAATQLDLSAFGYVEDMDGTSAADVSFEVVRLRVLVADVLLQIFGWFISFQEFWSGFDACTTGGKDSAAVP